MISGLLVVNYQIMEASQCYRYFLFCFVLIVHLLWVFLHNRPGVHRHDTTDKRCSLGRLAVRSSI